MKLRWGSKSALSNQSSHSSSWKSQPLPPIIFSFLFSAVPIGYLISLEISPPSTHVFHYHSSGGFLRECAKWDSSANRFLVSYFEGGLGEVRVPADYSPEDVLQEVTLAKDADVAGNASLGLVIDRPRNRVLVAVADVRILNFHLIILTS
ncbi:hypothetical protein LINGRAHAP2_LOCUS35044 [Linum grandiflorum]